MFYILAILVLFLFAPIIYARKHEEPDDEHSKVVLQAEPSHEGVRTEALPPQATTLPGGPGIATTGIGVRPIAG